MTATLLGSGSVDVSQRERRPHWQALALLSAGILLAGACSGDEPSDATDVPAPGPAIGTDELFDATASPVGDELWIVGGLRAPDGTSPPSSLIGPQWQPSESIQVYGPDGRILRRLQLPGPGGRVDAAVIADGDDRYVVGHHCADAAYCSGLAKPVLFRVDGETIEEIDLDVPPVEFGDSVAAGRVSVVGLDGDVLWVTQDLGAGAEIFGGVRLLAIDLDDGMATEVPLPDGVRGARSLCLGTAGVFVATARLEREQVELEALTVLRRPSSSTSGDWEEVASIPVDLGYVGDGAISCDDGSGDLVLSLQSSPPTVAAVDAETGAVTTPFTTLSESGVAYLGRIDSAGILLSSTASGTRTLWRRGDDGTVTQVEDVTIERRAHPVVLDGRLVDALAATESLDDRVDLPTIATDL